MKREMKTGDPWNPRSFYIWSQSYYLPPQSALVTGGRSSTGPLSARLKSWGSYVCPSLQARRLSQERVEEPGGDISLS